MPKEPEQCITVVQENPQIDLAKETKLDVDSAREILKRVIFCPEDSLTSLDTESVTNLKMEQIQEAALVVCEDLMEGVRQNEWWKSRMLAKPTELGMMLLQLQYSNPNRLKNSKVPFKPKTIELRIIDSINMTGDPIISTRFPLIPPQDSMDMLSVHYADSRDHEYIDFNNKGNPLTIEDNRLVWKGMRWLFANMLSWDNPEPIFPEHLKGRTLPDGKSSLLLPGSK